MQYSTSLRDDLNQTVVDVIRKYGIVNVPVVAERIRARQPDEGLTVLDAEHLVLGFAALYCAPIEFDRTGCAWRKRTPVSAENGGLILEFVEDDLAALAAGPASGNKAA
jgi:hypothetical protein